MATKHVVGTCARWSWDRFQAMLKDCCTNASLRLGVTFKIHLGFPRAIPASNLYQPIPTTFYSNIICQYMTKLEEGRIPVHSWMPYAGVFGRPHIPNIAESTTHGSVRKTVQQLWSKRYTLWLCDAPLQALRFKGCRPHCVANTNHCLALTT
eukprot:247670-Amphidinium_carterae.1